MLGNTKRIYGSVAKFFHWLMAFLILCMLCLGFFMASQKIIHLHQLTGLFILLLAASRLIWKLLNTDPVLPNTISKLEKIIAKSVQALLYVCMFSLPLSGWAMSTAFGLAPHLGHINLPMPRIAIDQAYGNFFSGLHTIIAYILMALIGMHILGACKHQWLDKNPSVLKSMLPNFKN